MQGLRDLSVFDCEEVLRINAESQPGVARLDRSEFERLIALKNEHFAIEGRDGGLTGYLLAFRSDAPYDGEEFLSFVESCTTQFIYIDQVAVEATQRRMGLASSLYLAVEAEAKRQRIPALCCEINLIPPNPSSLAFHQNKGFNQMAVLETQDGRTVALMTKSLKIMRTEARET